MNVVLIFHYLKRLGTSEIARLASAVLSKPTASLSPLVISVQREMTSGSSWFWMAKK